MIHNLDNSTAILNNSKKFSSRVQISSSSVKDLESIVRRLYRVFSHAFYHHKEIFYEFEVNIILKTITE